MAEFGKRRNAHSPRSDHRPATKPADLAIAVAVVETGKLPRWAETGPLPFVSMLLLSGIGFWFLILPYAGDLLRDYRLAGTWQPAYDMQIVEAPCTRYQLMVTTCDVKIRSRPDPSSAPLTVRYMVAFSSGGENLVPVRSTIDPSAVTINYSAEARILNRTATLLVMGGIFTMMFFLALNPLLRGQYKGGAAYKTLIANIEGLQSQNENLSANLRAAI